MSYVLRASKFRHVFGEPVKPEGCYSGIKAYSGTPEGMGLKGNTKFAAVSWNSAGGGSLAVLAHDKAGRLGANTPLIKGHKGPVLDFQFNPFDEYQIATGSDDNTVKIWQIPEGGVEQDISDPLVSLDGHQKKVHIVDYHPTANNILISASHDQTVKIWDVVKATAAKSFDDLFPEITWSVSWNKQGSLFVSTCKDKNVRIVDPRAGTAVSTFEAHEGAKPQKAIWLGSKDKICTLGFSRQSDRQIKVWDPRNLTEALGSTDVDVAAGMFMPMFDDDTNMLYLAGKGDTSVKYYEFIDEAPYMFFLSAYTGSKPQKAACMLPKLAGDIMKCEVARVLRLVDEQLEVVNMRVPRKNTDFQEDIFPETAAPVPALSAEEWLNGQNANPKTVSCKPGEGDLAPRKALKTAFQLQQELEDKDKEIEALKAELAKLKGQ
eukprot:c11119_g1_i1.p1 GENE.c11119_g1_i1~~c11119_g1_i1.p1  ORF type:complete len:448 (+),score=102.33 c11119_g1_i1:44-1345(+)